MIKKFFSSLERLYKPSTKDENKTAQRTCSQQQLNTKSDTIEWSSKESELAHYQMNAQLFALNKQWTQQRKLLDRSESEHPEGPLVESSYSTSGQPRGLPSPTRIRPVSISRREILSRINGFDCSTMMRRCESQPAFGESDEEFIHPSETCSRNFRNPSQDKREFISENRLSSHTIARRHTAIREKRRGHSSAGASSSGSSSGAEERTPPTEEDVQEDDYDLEHQAWSHVSRSIAQENLLSDIYNSENSETISVLKELTNQANNQVVLSERTDEDAWFCKRKLYEDHINEITHKLNSLDDEIWSKIICMERNRRVAKAYIRLPYLIVTGASTGFDGYTIGLSGFENTQRDPESEYIVAHLEKGVRIKMDEHGNLIMRRMCSATVQIKDWLQQLTEGVGALGDEIISLHGRLPFDRAVKVFDMTRFERNLQDELARERPDANALALQCVLPIAFGKNTYNLLNSPCWLMSINVIALRMITAAFSVPIPEPDYGEVPASCEEQISSSNESREDAEDCGHIYSSI